MAPTKTGSRAILVLMLVTFAAVFGCSLRRQLNAQALNPRPNFEIVPGDYGLTPEALWVPTDGAEIHAWVFHAADPVGTVVICNGNTGNKALFLPTVPYFTAAGYEVVLFDHRGFGLSTGKANLFAMVGDAVRVVDTVREREPSRPLVIFGTSLGSVVAVLVARARPAAVQALVLESLFSPREECRRLIGKVSGSVVCPAIIPRRLEVRRQLPRLAQPILVLHGDGDSISPLVSAAKMYRRTLQRPGSREFWLAAGAGHSPGLLGKYGPVYTRRIREFLDAHVSRQNTSSPPGYESRPGKAGVFEARFAPEAVSHDVRTPVEISIVYASGKTAVHHLWLEPGRLAIEIVVDARPLLVSARVVHDPVDSDGEGWTETELRTARRIEKQEQRLRELIGSQYSPFLLLTYGEPHAVPGKGYEWRPFDGGTAEECMEKADALLDLETDVRDAAGAAKTPEDRARAANLLAQVGAALELIDRADPAYELYATALKRLPKDPETVVLYGDGTWAIGMGDTIGPVLNRLIELAKTPEDRLRWLLELGEFEHAQLERRKTLARWRMREAETAPATSR